VEKHSGLSGEFIRTAVVSCSASSSSCRPWSFVSLNPGEHPVALAHSYNRTRAFSHEWGHELGLAPSILANCVATNAQHLMYHTVSATADFAHKLRSFDAVVAIRPTFEATSEHSWLMDR